MTEAEKEALQPFGEMFHQIGQMVRGLSDDQLQATLKACERVSSTNIWYASYDAAQYLPDQIKSEIHHRKQIAAAG